MDSQDPEQQANNEAGKSEEQIPSAVTELKVPISPPDAPKSDKCKKHWIDYTKLGLEILGFIVLCIYAYFTIRIYCANQKAANAASEALAEVRKQTGFAATSAKAAQDNVSAVQAQMRQDQRPWVKIGFPPNGPTSDPSKPMAKMTLESGKPIAVPLRFINTGKTPARMVESDILVEIARHGERMRFPVEPHEPLTKRARTTVGNHMETGVLFPDQFTEAVVTRARREDNGSLGPRPLTFSEAKDLIEHETLIYVYGRINYSDGFGVLHWTKFCKALSDEPMNPECAEYNAVDSN
jgi:hypothetical protein